MTNEHKRAHAAEVDPDGMFERAYAEAAGVAHEASRPRAANPQTEGAGSLISELCDAAYRNAGPAGHQSRIEHRAASLIQSQAAEIERWRTEYLNAASDAQKFAERIAELEAEVERLAEAIEEMEYSDGDASFWRHIAKQNAEALSRTGAVKVELSENTGELIDKMAEAIRGDTTSDDTPWATLSEDRKIGWRGDAERALAVVKEHLTARRPAEQAVTDKMVEAAASAIDFPIRGKNGLREAIRAALAQEGK